MSRTLDSEDPKMTPIHPGSHTGHVTCLVLADNPGGLGLDRCHSCGWYVLHPL